MSLFTSADYPNVRAALDVNLDATTLPDSVIGLDVYHAAAELDVLQRDPDAASRVGEDGTRVKLAAMLLCAARLAPAVPRLVATEASGTSFRFETADWTAVASGLRSQAEDLLAQVVGTRRADGSVHFGVGVGRRGRWG